MPGGEGGGVGEQLSFDAGQEVANAAQALPRDIGWMENAAILCRGVVRRDSDDVTGHSAFGESLRVLVADFSEIYGGVRKCPLGCSQCQVRSRVAKSNRRRVRRPPHRSFATIKVQHASL